MGSPTNKFIIMLLIPTAPARYTEGIVHRTEEFETIFSHEKNTRCAWAGGTCANYPDFFENHQFHVT